MSPPAVFAASQVSAGLASAAAGRGSGRGLLELHCGFGHNTVALAAHFKRVSAVFTPPCRTPTPARTRALSCQLMFKSCACYQHVKVYTRPTVSAIAVRGTAVGAAQW